MATTFAPAADDIVDQINAIWAERFPETRNIDPCPSLAVLMAVSDKDHKPALKHHGWPAAAIISIVPPEQRADGCADLRLKIDQAKWFRMTERQQEALIAHELLHVQVELEGSQSVNPPIVKTDDYGRPKVKLRPHDWEVGGFTAIVDWYGDDAIEKQIVTSINERLSQMVLPFMDSEQDGKRKAAAKG